MIIEALKCPWCGSPPEIHTDGSCIDIECCASMSFQKSDYLTMPERKTVNYATGNFPEAIEQKVLNIAIARWNTRVQKSDTIDNWVLT